MKWRYLIVAPALAFGCAHAPSVTNEQVVQLPDSARQQILDAHRGVEVADQNVVAAQVAVDEAKRFRDISNRELDAAKAQADAADRTLDLGRRSNTESSLRAARQNREAAVREVFAARAKKDYADRLIDLRRAEEDQRVAERDLAHADFEYVKYVQLRDNNLAAGMSESEFLSARERAQNDVASARGRTAGLRGNVESLRTAWLQRANEVQTASRGAIVPPPAPPPPLAPPVENERTFTPPPAGGPNEGPSSPQSLPQD